MRNVLNKRMVGVLVLLAINAIVFFICGYLNKDKIQDVMAVLDTLAILYGIASNLLKKPNRKDKK